MAAQDAPRRSWRGVIILSTILATGFAGLAAALTLKGSFLTAARSTPAISGGLPIIMAGGPTKIQPPTSGPDAADDQASVLDKTSSLKTAAAKVVDTVEQPVDLSQQKPKDDRSAAASPGPLNVPSLAASAVAPEPPRLPARSVVASLEPTVPGPVSAQSTAPAPAATERSSSEDTAAPVGTPGFPTPKRVKVISVRPDGSIIGSEQPSGPADAATPRAPESNPSSVAVAPSAEAPAPGLANDAVGNLIDQGRTDSVKRAADPSPSAAEPAPETRLLATKSRHGKAKPTEVADLNGDAGRPVEHDGTFAAQLAASPTEAAAKASLRKLQKQYGSSFSGHRLSYRRVRVDGKTVYRVRLGSLSKDDADSVCGKLQADGGNCFVAKN